MTSSANLISKTLRLPAWMWVEIAEYRTRVGAVTVSDAIRRLLLEALRAEARRPVRDA
jgi:hypothetical protein